MNSMREIKFRGKDTFDDVWRYGSLTINKDGSMAITDGADHYGYSMIHCGVYPESVGQYTGLKDKNGKEIYEGDIVRHRYAVRWDTEWTTSVVVWDEVHVAFRLNNLYNNSDQTAAFGKTKFCHPMHIEIIGNIHDNPELLGEKGE